MDMNEKIETLVGVIDRLCGLLENETTHLSAQKFKAISEAIEEKDKLCRAFELLVRGLSKDKLNLNQTDDFVRKSLQECGERLDALVSTNASALKVAIQANERLMAAVRNAAIECTPNAGNYSNTGHLMAGTSSVDKTPTPVTYNQVL